MARFALSVILSCTIASAVAAQDAIPETPPELRDFRLDPQPPAAQPQPQPRTETVTPPPVAPTITEPSTASARPQRQSQPRTVEAPSPTASPTPDTIGTEPVSAAPEVIEDAPDALPTESQPVPLPEAAPASLSMWQIAAGFALLVMALLAGFWFRRKRAAATERPQEPEIASPQTEALRTAEPARPVVAATPAQPAKKVDIMLDFIPERATVSFTTLTVKGQLCLINEGSTPAKDMQLRAGLVSASARQDETIEAFHSTSAQVKAEPLGDAKPGERIGMAIELSVPLIDMESFAVGDQKLLVPIVVANLSYGNGSTSHQQTARIACMIGREATPPAPKMGPLRLDLGPRSFAPLGQRPLNV